jgi:5-methylcytosine-specific restriction protein A
MPTAPLRYCATARCSAKVPYGHCHRHQRERDRQRGTAHDRGYTSSWRIRSKAWLEEHLFCEDCLAQGERTRATVVDHKVPHRGNQGLFWDESNWSALCKRHHDVKTARLDHGFGR